jgi:hypothetical protein
VVAEQHAHRRVEDLRGHAVALLVGHPRVRVPAAAVQVLEAGAERPQLLRRASGGSDQPHGDRPVEALDHEDVAALVVAHHPRRAVEEAPIDAVDVRPGRLGHVGVGGDDGCAHGLTHRAIAISETISR